MGHPGDQVSLKESMPSLKNAFNSGKTDPATEWEDNIWPLRQQTPWDISTDYSYPRKLDYEVTEGTWLRLDVHPISGDIVFDMIGDIYCLPGRQALRSNTEAVNARPILTGIPHDSDPHFSPSGDRLVFRSDAELGVENIWVTEWKGCEEMDVRSPSQYNEELQLALSQQEYEEGLLTHGVKESPTRRTNRLLREGRLTARRVTNETYRWVTDARFHPSGHKVIATKWYTSERSLGAGEGWEYDVPSIHELRTGTKNTIQPGSGTRLVSRSLPLGWTSENYGDQQIGPEQFVWKGNDALIFAKNVIDSSKFTYSKDIHKGIYSIFQKNLTTDSTITLVDSTPGGASRPELSRDGRTLAFVRRVRDKEALVLKDLRTGSIHNIWYGLTYDVSAISAPMGTYPSFAFTPADDAVIIWAAGQIYSVPLATNSLGEKVASSSDSPKAIQFVARIKKRLANTRSGGVDLVHFETQDTQDIRSLQDLRANDEGTKVVFQAAGTTYWQHVGKNISGAVPVMNEEASYYSPTFVPGDDSLVLHARWSDSTYTTFELSNLNTNTVHEIEVPFGRYFSPILCKCHGSERTIAFVKSAGSYLSGEILATAGEGLYMGEITLPPVDATNSHKITIRNLRFVPTEIDFNGDDSAPVVNMRFIHTNQKLLIQQSRRAFVIHFAGKHDLSGKPPHRNVASGEMSTELVVVPKSNSKSALDIAFADFFHVYFVSGKHVKKGEAVWSRPGNATKGLARLSLDGGHSITFSANGERLFWFLGPYLHYLETSTLSKCSSAIRKDQDTFGVSCVKTLVRFQQVNNVKHTTDIARLKQEAANAVALRQPWLEAEINNSDVLVVYNATLLTMESGNAATDLVNSGILVVRGGVIEYAGPLKDYNVPPGATVIDADGGYVVPGFLDVHAHWNGFSDRYPAKSWELETFLAYGITTLHNPSADTVSAFSERSRVEAGKMVGPRIFTTGTIIYGAASPGIHQDIVDMAEASSALIRIKAEGGPASISYKNYNIPSRASRQRLLKVAQDMSMLCVPEGGMNFDWDLTYIIDGMTTVEHPLPIPQLYDDVITLYALSGTGATPTHIVNYGGAWGEQLVWATEDVPNNPKLRRFTRHDILEFVSESTARPKDSYAFLNTSRSIAAMVDKGLLANVGAHGEPPLGVNYHAEMGFFGMGGLSNYEVIRAATSSGARTLGMFPSLGSLSRGKLADFLVYPPGIDLLVGEVSEKTRQLRFVARGGRIWEADSMVEFWPVKGRKQTMPVLNAD
uniref:Amidohydrolase-related domain-containing protein n=1 Tax=Psilocybe cubensis TaxID=181762 RepID=A0A8H7Y2X4_PSICU